MIPQFSACMNVLHFGIISTKPVSTAYLFAASCPVGDNVLIVAPLPQEVYMSGMQPRPVSVGHGHLLHCYSTSASFHALQIEAVEVPTTHEIFRSVPIQIHHFL